MFWDYLYISYPNLESSFFWNSWVWGSFQYFYISLLGSMYVNTIFIMQILNIFINKTSQKRQQMHTCKNSTNHLSYFCFPTSELPGIESRVWKFHEYIMSCDIKVHLYGIITCMFIMVFMKKKTV